MAIKILVVDDHPIFLAGILVVLKNNSNINVVATAENGEVAIEKAKELQPDIVIMDISMPGIDGIEATKQILEQSEKIKVLALSIHAGKRFVKQMLNAGASGYLPKDVAADEIVTAIDQISKGNMYLSPTITSVALMDEVEPHTNSNYPILKTKLHRPLVRNDYVIRRDLIEKLEKNRENPLSLIIAPAGYGKSVTISEWLDTTKSLYAWISLDEEHNQLRVFLQYLITALEQLFPETFIKTAKLLQASELPALKSISLTLINELDYIKQDYVLVLDDYHKINNEHIHTLISDLLSYPPECMHISIITRRDPPLAIKRLRMNNRLLDIRMKDLSFTGEEAKELFFKLHHIELNDTVVESLITKTEGWITGICLAIMNIEDPDKMKQSTIKMDGKLNPFADFMIEEVLSKLDADFQNLLLSIAVLDRFCEELIDAILKVDSEFNGNLDGKGFINQLVNTNLFVIPLDKENKWFRFHHLFQEWLKQELLKKQSKKQIVEIHRAVAGWEEKFGTTNKAIDYYLEAGDELEAAIIVEKQAHKMFLNSVFQVEIWLGKIPSRLREQRPTLLLIDAWIAYRQLKLERLPAILEKVGILLEGQTLEPQVMAELNFFQGNFAYWMGGLQETKAGIDALKQALKVAGNLPVHIVSNIELILNLSLQKTGEKESLELDINKQILAMDKSTKYRLSFTVASLAFVQLLSGKFLNGKAAAMQMQGYTQKHNEEYLLSWSYYFLAVTNTQLYLLEEAIAPFEMVEKRSSSLDRRVVIDSIAIQALIFHFQNEPELAQKKIDSMIAYAEELNDPMVSLIAQSAKARIDILRGNIEEAMQWAKSFTALPAYGLIFMWLEVPWITKAKVLIVKGSDESLKLAIELLDELLDIVTSNHLNFHLVEINLLLSVVMGKTGRSEESMRYLKNAVILADSQNCIRPFIEAGKSVTVLLNSLKEKGVANDFIEKIENLDTNLSLKKGDVIQLATEVSEKVILTYRELEILRLLDEGLRNKEIANKLYVSEGTIKKHAYNMGQKLDTSSRRDLLNKARAMGYIE